VSGLARPRAPSRLRHGLWHGRGLRLTAANRAAARAAAATGVALLLAAGSAGAASSITKHRSASMSVSAGRTRTLTVPYPDALEYGNARYSGHAAVKLVRTTGPASAAKVRILSAGPVEGGSAFQVRVHNGNAAGTGSVRVRVTATTVEPLPHH